MRQTTKKRQPQQKRNFTPREPPKPSTGGRSGRHVYGINPVLEALRARPEEIEHIVIADGYLASGVASELFSRAKEAGVRVQKLPRERLSTLSEGGVHQGVVAQVREYEYADVDEILEMAQESGRPPLIVVLDGIQDPHNLGAIVRSAHALGAHGVVIPKDRAVGVTGVVAKASAGAIEHCKVARVVNLSRALEQLKEAGLWVVAADPKAETPVWEARLDGPLAILVGAEGAGIREGVLKQVDIRCQIPMKGQVSSLNASVSASILLFEATRQASH